MIDNLLIQRCSNPVSIRDVVNGGFMYVSCGKCEACRSSYKSMWMQRLDAECKSAAVTLFFTLTYYNDCVPALEYDSIDNVLRSNRTPEHDIYLDYPYTKDNELKFYDVSTFPKIQNDNVNTFRIAYACKSDIQKFFKRLRRRVQYDKKALLENVPSVSRSFRYFVTSEYGPETLRPHFHGLMFFDNVDVANSVKNCYFGEAWQFCDPKNMDISKVVSSASGYVAKYVNCDTCLPDILQIPGKTKSFYLCSRKPAIGVNMFDYNSMVFKIEHNSTKYDRLVFDNNVPISITVPIFRSAVSYYFPKIYNAYGYDYEQLCNFYRSAYQYCSSEMIKRFKVNSYNLLRPYVSSKLPNYIKEVDSILLDFQKISPNAKLSDIYDSLSYEYQIYGISQNRTAIIKFLIFSAVNNLTVFDYVNNYIKFYSVRSNETLNHMYEYQNYLSAKGLDKVTIATFCYPAFFNSLPRHIYNMSDDQRINFDLSIASLGICEKDVYNQSGILIHTKASILKKYLSYEDYIKYSNDVKDRLADFEKKRKLNHFINQKKR